MMSILEIRRAISRLQELFSVWDRDLDRIDKEYVLRRIRDKEPELFCGIANERY